MKKNVQPITGCGEGDIAPFVFLCGDPERVPSIAEGWSGAQEVRNVREYTVITGTLEGVPMTAASTGIGAPSTAIAVEELAKLGARVFIRVGNSGGLAEAVKVGDYVITTGAVRDDGTSKSYVIPEYPAVAHYEVVGALAAAAQASGARHHIGVTWSMDSFYGRNKVVAAGGGLGTMCYGDYNQSWMNGYLLDLKAAGIVNCEMEAGVLLTLAGLFGLKAGCICTVSDLAPWPGPSADSIDLNTNMAGCIEIATKAMLALAKRD